MRKQHDDEFVDEPALRRELEALLDASRRQSSRPACVPRLRANRCWYRWSSGRVDDGVGTAAAASSTLDQLAVRRTVLRPARPRVQGRRHRLPRRRLRRLRRRCLHRQRGPLLPPPGARAIRWLGRTDEKGARRLAAARDARAAPGAGGNAARSGPEALVAADQARALRALIAGGREGRMRAPRSRRRRRPRSFRVRHGPRVRWNLSRWPASGSIQCRCRRREGAQQ